MCIYIHIQSYYLCKHRFAILGHHGALVTVKGHKVTMKGLLWMLQNIEELSGTPLKDTSEVPRNQRSANGCRQNASKLDLKDQKRRKAVHRRWHMHYVQCTKTNLLTKNKSRNWQHSSSRK